MQTLAEIKQQLEERGLRPKRSLGQNFLIDHNLIRKLVDASGVGMDDNVLEVGPGTGTMTEELLARGCRVVACELDDELAALLRDRMPETDGGGNFHLVQGDCLDGKRTVSPAVMGELQSLTRTSAVRPPTPDSHLPTSAFSLVANLPYGAATPLITTLLLDHPECGMLAVTIQKEVVDRLAAKPGTKDYGALAVIAQVFAEVEKIATCPPECFWPRPDVTSGMVLLRRRATPIASDGSGLSAWLRVLFAQRRKQIGSLVKGVDWAKVAGSPGCEGILPTMRAEELAPERIVKLGQALGAIKSDGS